MVGPPANGAAMTPVAKERELNGSVKSAREAVSKTLTACVKGL